MYRGTYRKCGPSIEDLDLWDFGISGCNSCIGEEQADLVLGRFDFSLPEGC